MTTFQKLIERLVKDGGLDNCRVRGYSGRGMFGRECLAVAGDDANVIIQSIAYEAGQEDIAMPRGVRTDSLGLGAIVYWPSIPYEENEGGVA